MKRPKGNNYLKYDIFISLLTKVKYFNIYAMQGGYIYFTFYTKK